MIDKIFSHINVMTNFREMHRQQARNLSQIDSISLCALKQDFQHKSTKAHDMLLALKSEKAYEQDIVQKLNANILIMQEEARHLQLNLQDLVIDHEQSVRDMMNLGEQKQALSLKFFDQYTALIRAAICDAFDISQELRLYGTDTAAFRARAKEIADYLAPDAAAYKFLLSSFKEHIFDAPSLFDNMHEIIETHLETALSYSESCEVTMRQDLKFLNISEIVAATAANSGILITIEQEYEELSLLHQELAVKKDRLGQELIASEMLLDDALCQMACLLEEKSEILEGLKNIDQQLTKAGQENDDSIVSDSDQNEKTLVTQSGRYSSKQMVVVDMPVVSSDEAQYTDAIEANDFTLTEYKATIDQDSAAAQFSRMQSLYTSEVPRSREASEPNRNSASSQDQKQNPVPVKYNSPIANLNVSLVMMGDVAGSPESEVLSSLMKGGGLDTYIEPDDISSQMVIMHPRIDDEYGCYYMHRSSSDVARSPEHFAYNNQDLDSLLQEITDDNRQTPLAFRPQNEYSGVGSLNPYNALIAKSGQNDKDFYALAKHMQLARLIRNSVLDYVENNRAKQNLQLNNADLLQKEYVPAIDKFRYIQHVIHEVAVNAYDQWMVLDNHKKDAAASRRLDQFLDVAQRLESANSELAPDLVMNAFKNIIAYNSKGILKNYLANREYKTILSNLVNELTNSSF